MVVSAVGCGLGNQFFQYAMGRRLAARRGVPLKLDLDWFQTPLDLPGLEMFERPYRLKAFNIVAEVATREEVTRFAIPPRGRFDPRRLRGPWWRFLRRHFPARCRGMYIVDDTPNFRPELLDLPGDVYLGGWWQSEKYFADYAAPLRAEFTLRDTAAADRAAAYADSHRRDGRPLVAVQVRRGDVARAHEVLKDLTNMPYELVSAEYLRAAMAEYGDGATFLVFTETAEDIAWCRAHLHARDIHFAGGHDDLHDFVAMSRCDHNIISNSSFGWWAAWLNPNPGRTVVAPRRWYRPAHSPHHDIHSLIPAGWLIK